jgi:hypothetical protein
MLPTEIGCGLLGGQGQRFDGQKIIDRLGQLDNIATDSLLMSGAVFSPTGVCRRPKAAHLTLPDIIPRRLRR